MQSIKTMLNNDNVINKLTNNDNVNNVSNKVKKADHLADRLVKELGNEDYRAFYCKVAYKLSESQIMSALEQSLKGNDPARYFTWLVKRQM